MIRQPFNLKAWIDEHRDLLKPPVGNQVIYKDNSDFIVMVVGGPNKRKDYHIDAGEEIFFQLEGDVKVRLMLEDGPKTFDIREGDMFMVPAGVPHMPIRPAGTAGLVIERYRKPNEKDGFLWVCENCGQKLHEEYIEVSDIVEQLPVVMNLFFENEDLHTCKNCGTVMAKPE
jgi:3-hydroxyanthranilate 3,4-dioxygenase